VDVDTAVTREEAGTLVAQGDAAYSPECVERGFSEVRSTGGYALPWSTR
jgi:hypothetical protein